MKKGCLRCTSLRSDALTPPSPTGLRDPHKKIGTVGSLSIQGEGWGEGEHAASVVVPFTLRSLLLWNDRTGERAMAAQSPPPWQPGLPARKSSLRDALSLFLSAFGSCVILHPCRSRPLGASLRLAPAYRKRFGDFQPDQSIAVSLLISCNPSFAFRTRKLLGIPQPTGRGWSCNPLQADIA